MGQSHHRDEAGPYFHGKEQMKTHLIIISIILFTSLTVRAGLFDNAEDKKRIQVAEQKLDQQRQSNGQLLIVCGVLGTGCVVLLVVGAAIGAKARKAVKNE
jgi:hypothetical protein